MHPSAHDTHGSAAKWGPCTVHAPAGPGCIHPTVLAPPESGLATRVPAAAASPPAAFPRRSLAAGCRFTLPASHSLHCHPLCFAQTIFNSNSRHMWLAAACLQGCRPSQARAGPSACPLTRPLSIQTVPMWGQSLSSVPERQKGRHRDRQTGGRASGLAPQHDGAAPHHTRNRPPVALCTPLAALASVTAARVELLARSTFPANMLCSAFTGARLGASSFAGARVQQRTVAAPAAAPAFYVEAAHKKGAGSTKNGESMGRRHCGSTGQCASVSCRRHAAGGGERQLAPAAVFLGAPRRAASACCLAALAKPV